MLGGGYVQADPTEIPTVMRTKFPATVMVFGVISESVAMLGDPMSSKKIRLHPIKFSKSSWMAENSHHVTLNLWLPPNSPDLNPLHYYVWAWDEAGRG
ncbi:hypothetical protein ACTXT7_010570 [Hymenolepis weldensis]